MHFNHNANDSLSATRKDTIVQSSALPRRNSKMFKSLTVATFLSAVATYSFAQEESFPILFTNVHVFDGVNEERIENANVLVVDNLIADVSTEPLAVANAQIIDGGGRTLMPGLIDAHVHMSITEPIADLRDNFDFDDALSVLSIHLFDSTGQFSFLCSRHVFSVSHFDLFIDNRCLL